MTEAATVELDAQYRAMREQAAIVERPGFTAIAVSGPEAADYLQGQELEILETVRDKVPAEVFTTPYTNPVNGNPDNVRNNRREALRLESIALARHEQFPWHVGSVEIMLSVLGRSGPTYSVLESIPLRASQ